MATQQAVWGIDIGQCALKALRISVDPEAEDKFIADAFDHIEYAKILSQPEADPVALVREAIEQFLSRNEVRNDRVAISVPGQAGLARFIKLPPVESKKIPDIVKFEAKQQIPFDLGDVIWDYQRMAGGTEEEGFSLETEVGLFAMKRDQVFAALEPFTNAGIDVDFVQLAPLAIYNFLVADQLGGLGDVEEYDPEDPPESLILLAMGTDTTDLVISNGFRVWQRSIPIGGNHFTKALTKELKLTFSKAEHLKRNATKADDPKAVFQAMRPVFSDLLTEIRRSVGYFMNLNREAKVKRMLALGNAMRLPGLQKYLVQNLGYEVIELKQFKQLKGSGVVGSPVFKENMLSFPVAYGLAIQGCGRATLGTNLVPREIVRDRIIRTKKPWAVATAAVVLIGCAISYFGNWLPWRAAHPKDFAEAKTKVAATASKFNQFKAELAKKEGQLKQDKALEAKIKVHVDERYQMPEVVAALATALPNDEDFETDINDREQLHITSVLCLPEPNLSSWSSRVNAIDPVKAGRGEEQEAEKKVVVNPGKKPAKTPPKRTPSRGRSGGRANASGSGYVVTIEGYHLFNRNADRRMGKFVEETLFNSLKSKQFKAFDKNGESVSVRIKDLGLTSPIFTMIKDKLEETIVLNPSDPDNLNGVAGMNMPLRFDFRVEMAYKPSPRDSLRTSPYVEPKPEAKPAPTETTKTEG